MGKPLTFTVGPYVYRLYYVDDLRGTDGVALWGLCLADRQEILIDATATPAQKFDTLVHELAHAWDFAVGEPRDAEARGDRTATLLRSLLIDFERQAERVEELRELGANRLRTVAEAARSAEWTGRAVANG